MKQSLLVQSFYRNKQLENWKWNLLEYKEEDGIVLNSLMFVRANKHQGQKQFIVCEADIDGTHDNIKLCPVRCCTKQNWYK